MGFWKFKDGQILDMASEKFVPNTESIIEVLDEEDREIVLADDTLLVPGLVDMHSHWWDRDSTKGIDGLTMEAGLMSGIIAGNEMGCFGINGWKRATRIWDFSSLFEVKRIMLHVLPDGTVALGGRMFYGKDCSVDKMVEAYHESNGRILGFKVHVGFLDTQADKEWLQIAREAADLTGGIVAVHIRGACTPLDEILDYLKPGDILCHILGSSPGGIILDREGNISPKLIEAVKNGIRLDTGVARLDFSFKLYTMLKEAGIEPTFISSDAIYRNWNLYPAYTLIDDITKFVAAGMDESEAFIAASKRPADVLGVPMDYSQNMLIIEKEHSNKRIYDNCLSCKEYRDIDFSYANRIFIVKNKLVFDYEMTNACDISVKA